MHSPIVMPPKQPLFNSLPNVKIMDRSKLKAFADKIWNENEKIEICFGKGRKHCWKRRKCWLPAFSPFPTMFSKGIFLRVVKSRNKCGKKLNLRQDLDTWLWPWQMTMTLVLKKRSYHKEYTCEIQKLYHLPFKHYGQCLSFFIDKQSEWGRETAFSLFPTMFSKARNVW